MLGKRSVRIVALVLILIAGCAALLGWDLVYEQQLTDRFVEPPSPIDKMQASREHNSTNLTAGLSWRSGLRLRRSGARL